MSGCSCSKAVERERCSPADGGSEPEAGEGVITGWSLREAVGFFLKRSKVGVGFGGEVDGVQYPSPVGAGVLFEHGQQVAEGLDRCSGCTEEGLPYPIRAVLHEGEERVVGDEIGSGVTG